MERFGWPQHSCKGDIGAFDRFIRFHQFQGREGVTHGLRLRRIVLDNKSGEKKAFGKVLKEYMEKYDAPRAEAYSKYKDCDLTGLMKEMTKEKATGVKHTMAYDLITLFSNFNITNPPEPQCLRENKLDKDTTKLLDKAIADAALRVEIENIDKLLVHQDRYEFFNKVSKKNMIRRVSENAKKKFINLNGKDVLKKLEERLAAQGKGFGYNRETHAELANVIESVLSRNGHDPLSHSTKDATATLCLIIGENVREEKSQGINRTLALAAMRKELPEHAHEPCFGAPYPGLKTAKQA